MRSPARTLSRGSTATVSECAGALHPELAKRGFDYGPDSVPAGIHNLGAEHMVASAARGPRDRYGRTCEITFLDMTDDIASLKLVSEPFID